jgi:pimeloyl-ACP methyl ester carboxylesterase
MPIAASTGRIVSLGRAIPLFAWICPAWETPPVRFRNLYFSSSMTEGTAPVLSAVVKELTARYELGGMVLLGHCAGAVTAMYTAAMTPECKGLVLTDPYFHLEHEKADLVVAVKDWVMWGPVAKVTRYLFHALRSVYLLVKRLRTTGAGSGLPRNANVPMLRRCKQLLSSGVPMLVMQSPRWAVGQFNYLDHLESSARSKTRMSVVPLEGVDHSFANCAARKAVLENTGKWLKRYFPPHLSKTSSEGKTAQFSQIYANS